MWYVIGVFLLFVILYLIINGSRNSDPLNRKCAAEICQYLTNTSNPDPIEIAEIFLANARYKNQANHIVSMVPDLLIRLGVSEDAAMGFVPIMRAAAQIIPK
jgi:hypothetical protein